MKFSWPVRVYYEDTDSGGVVYYANYLKFFERARTELFRQLDLHQDQLITEENVIFAVRNISVEYLKPAVFNDALQVETYISEYKNASMVFEQEIYREQLLLCRAQCKVACLQADSLKPRKMPGKVINAVNAMSQTA